MMFFLFIMYKNRGKMSTSLKFAFIVVIPIIKIFEFYRNSKSS